MSFPIPMAVPTKENISISLISSPKAYVFSYLIPASSRNFEIPVAFDTPFGRTSSTKGFQRTTSYLHNVLDIKFDLDPEKTVTVGKYDGYDNDWVGSKNG